MSDLTALVAAARALLGPDVAVAGADPRQDQPPVWPGEAIAGIPSRQREFAAGRSAARVAMAALGHPPAVIPRQPDRSPLWPAGIAGSITHSATGCLAALRRRGLIGIDIEPAAALDPALWPEVLRPDERAALDSDPEPGKAALIRFSAKEAVYKALYPQSGEVLGFEVMSITLDGSSTFIATLHRRIGHFAEGSVLRGGRAEAGGHILTVFTQGD